MDLGSREQVQNRQDVAGVVGHLGCRILRSETWALGDPRGSGESAPLQGTGIAMGGKLFIIYRAWVEGPC